MARAQMITKGDRIKLTRKNAKTLKRRIRDLEDENASLKKHLDRQGEKYKKLVDRMIELLFGDGECL